MIVRCNFLFINIHSIGQYKVYIPFLLYDRTTEAISVLDMPFYGTLYCSTFCTTLPKTIGC